MKLINSPLKVCLRSGIDPGLEFPLVIFDIVDRDVVVLGRNIKTTLAMSTCYPAQSTYTVAQRGVWFTCFSRL